MIGRQTGWNKAERVITAVTALLFISIAVVNFLGVVPQPRSSTLDLPLASGRIQAVGSIMDPGAWVLERPRFIIFGDSLTERSLGMGGWGSSLAHHYVRKVDVINRGFGGYNTNWALLQMDQIFAGASAANTLLVTLFFGANDAAIPLPDGTPHSARQHVPVSQYKENLRQMVGKLRERGLDNIVLITPPPVYEPGRKEAQRLRVGPEEAAKLPLDRTNTYTKQYVDSCKEVAEETGLPVVDVWSSIQQEKDWGTKLLNDGLHMTIEGNQHVYEAVQQIINSTYPSLRVEALPMHFPAWDAIDASNPAASLSKPTA